MSEPLDSARFDHIDVRSQDAVGVITMNRPERFNALDVRMARDLRWAALQFARDAQIRCVVLAGTATVFSSGVDLKYVRQRGDGADLSYLQQETDGPPPSYGETFKEILEYIHSTISEIRRAPKPFLAAVQGMAAAGGFGLAMSCDLVLASQEARFEWAYNKTGLTGAESTTFLLPRLLGLHKAFEMAYLNPTLSAAEALEAGLINRVFPSKEFQGKVMELACRLAKGPTQAFATTKKLLNQAAGIEALDSHMDRERRELSRIADGEDFRIGLEAFLAKCPPLFKGG